VAAGERVLFPGVRQVVQDSAGWPVIRWLQGLNSTPLAARRAQARAQAVPLVNDFNRWKQGAYARPRPRAAQVRRVVAVESEQSYQRRVIEYAELQGWTLIYHTYFSGRSTAGFPDLVLVRPPRVLFVELKTDVGQLRLEQRLWQAGLLRCPGVEYYCWRPRDWESARTRLSRRVAA